MPVNCDHLPRQAEHRGTYRSVDGFGRPRKARMGSCRTAVRPRAYHSRKNLLRLSGGPIGLYLSFSAHRVFAVPFGPLPADSDMTGACGRGGGAQAAAQRRSRARCHCRALGTLGWACGGPWHRHEVWDSGRSCFSRFLPCEDRPTIPPRRVSCVLRI